MTDRPQRIFLTDKRRQVLENDTDDLSEKAVRGHEYRIRVRARMALEELIEVYESDVIDNSEVFESHQIIKLLQELVQPDQITRFSRFDGTQEEHHEEYSYEYQLLADADRATTMSTIRLLGPPEEFEETATFTEKISRFYL